MRCAHMTEKDTYKSRVEEIRKEYIDKLTSLAWSYIDDRDAEAGARFISGCIDKIEAVGELLNEYQETDLSIEDLLERLYQKKKVEKNYAETVYLLRDVESGIDYGMLVINEAQEQVDYEDLMIEMESFFDELSNLNIK